MRDSRIDRRWAVEWDSPVGRLRLVANEQALVAIQFLTNDHLQTDLPPPFSGGEDHPVLQTAIAQLQEYFAGRRRQFTVPVHLEGTPFQRRVWQALQEIPFGRVISYRMLAGRIGQPAAVRAVGQANRKNPIPIIVPCHRVINHNGKPGGYAGGLDIKRKLLALEGIRL
ncbi:MAG: methylated-DNA--[protein]-cysteine S-methyltransferase [Calditrichaeota bacterium]|nr:methylated-DNA--[protein]-cysteine S-methyltransferase [Calditrichota bacterium]